jgi:uncharacterized protein YndB with AHSA1/START domain
VFEKAFTPTSLKIRGVFRASRQRVFEAWTKPDLLKQWFRPAQGYSVSFAEVDLWVGGKYRLGMLPPDEEEMIAVSGEYREIKPWEKLVFTWAWESDDPETEATLVTVEFFDRGGHTEVVLTHERFPHPEARDRHVAGWEGCLAGLAALFDQKEVRS